MATKTTNSSKVKYYRFFYHYNKQSDKMTIHFRNKCHQVDYILCNAACESKRNKRQPRIVMQGFTKDVKVVPDKDCVVGVIY